MVSTDVHSAFIHDFRRLQQAGVSWNNDHMFVSGHLTIAGSLGLSFEHEATTQPGGLVFKQLPRDPANVNCMEKPCMIPIFHTNVMYINFLVLRAVPDEKIWGSLKAKHYMFMGVVGVGCFSIQWLVVFFENVILQVVVLLKMQFCGYPTFKWDLVGCLGLNRRMENISSIFLKEGCPEKNEICGC